MYEKTCLIPIMKQSYVPVQDHFPSLYSETIDPPVERKLKCNVHLLFNTTELLVFEK